MRYSPEYKEQARAKITAATGRYAKQHGFDGSGMADLASAAGVTTGSLYKHFSGKADFFATLIKAELKRTADMYAAVDATDSVQVNRALAGYLSLSHVQQPGLGCPLPSLTAEVSRADDAVKLAFEEGLLEIHAKVSLLTGDSSVAWAVMAQNVGAVMLARAAQSEELRREILGAARQASDTLLGSELPALAARQS
jgi:TetR/AcrR family transcriptional regulator, transcriptional repressor for nem operon